MYGQKKRFFTEASNSAGVLDVMHVMVQCGRRQKYSETLFFSRPLSFVGYRSLRGHTKVPLRTLNLLVVGKIGFGFINHDDRVFFALTPLTEESDVIDPRCLGTLR